MKTILLLAFGLWLQSGPALALSIAIGRDIQFPDHYDPAKQAAIRQVIQDGRFKFVSGNVSHWPPDWATRLSFSGDADSLNAFLRALRDIHGIGLKVILYHGHDDELRRDSAWQLDFSQAHPDQLTVYINLNTKDLDLGNVKIPEWPPAT
jgi:hypothetical protein